MEVIPKGWSSSKEPWGCAIEPVLNLNVRHFSVYAMPAMTLTAIGGRDSMGLGDPNMRSGAFIMGNAPQAASPTGYITYLPDRQHLPVELGLARVDANPGVVGAWGTRQIMMVEGVSGKQPQPQPRHFEMAQADARGLAPAMSEYSQQPIVGGHNMRMAEPSAVQARLVGQPVNASQALHVQRSPQHQHPPPEGNAKSWFVVVVDEARRAERGFKLLEIVGPMRLDNSCSAIEWRRSGLGGISFDVATFVKTSTVPAQLVLSGCQWVPVRTIGGRMHRQSADIEFLMVSMARVFRE